MQQSARHAFAGTFAQLALVSLLVFAGNANALAQKITLLVINSHPDDEGIFFGGTLPCYTTVLKVPTLLLSMTSGDWTPTNLTIREAELRCAAQTYGFTNEPLFARFRDVPSHSMANNPYTNKIDATWDYWADGVLQGDGADVEAGKARAICYVAEQIRRYQPEVIITHDDRGEYGHDNHRATAYAVTNAFFLAADPGASADDLAGLPPWQAKKLYLHLWPTNRLFHTATGLPFAELGNRTPSQLADLALDCHVSQKKPDVSTVFKTGENYDAYPCEWWGLYASTVGPDARLETNVVELGYTIPAGVARGNFLQHILAAPATNSPPVFTANRLELGSLLPGASLITNLNRFVTDFDRAWDETLAFTKLTGPAWFQIASDGSTSGSPGIADLGTNLFSVRVTDRGGLAAEAVVLAIVHPPGTGLNEPSGWWKLDELSGGTAADSSPAARNGIASSGVSFNQPGARAWTANSALFSGMTNGKIDIAWSAALNPVAFTIACWAKVTGGAGTYRSPLTSRRDGPQSGWALYAGNNNRWQFWTGKTNGWNTLSAGPVENSVWIHLAGTYDGRVARFFTNGALASSNLFAFRPNDATPLRIGAGASENPDGQYFFPGYVDDVRVYNFPLNATRIAALYSNTPPVLPMLSPITRTGGNLTVSGQGFPGEPYVLLFSNDLEGYWFRAATNFSDAGGNFSFTLSSPATPAFYRAATAY